jgi:hypothetical protein
MSQNDLIVADADGATVLSDINSNLQALGSTSKGNNAPGTPYAGQLWVDDNTPSSTVWTLSQFDGTDWIPLCHIDTTNNAINWINYQAQDVASATTTVLDTAYGKTVDVTGTTTITAITLAKGSIKIVRFTGALTLTNGASLVLPGGANITTAAGDYAIFVGYGSSVVRCAHYQRAAAIPGMVLQRVSTLTGAVATGTTTIPFDDTIPQNTEGTQFMSLSITPKSATSILVIEVCAYLTSSVAIGIPGSLFQDSTASALAAALTETTTSGGGESLNFTHIMTSGTTSSTTFKFRAGPTGAATVTFNGSGGGRIFGGVMASSMRITEYAQ